MSIAGSTQWYSVDTSINIRDVIRHMTPTGLLCFVLGGTQYDLGFL